MLRVLSKKPYLLGREFTIYNDHKPLIQLLNNPNSTIPPRIERMTLRLQGYTFIMKHVSSEDNISDYTSRHPITNNSDNTETNFIDSYINMLTKFAVPNVFSLDSIAQATDREKLLQALKWLILNENWYKLNEDKKPDELANVDIVLLKRFRAIKSELTYNFEKGIILKGDRIVLPSVFHKDAVKIGHLGHQGIDKTKRLMRTKVFFFSMDEMIEKEIQHCISCQATATRHKPAPLNIEDIPDTTWHTIHIDYLGPLPFRYNKYHLVMVDKRSRYPVVEFVNSTTASELIKVLTKTFSSFGLPTKVISENGPPFFSKAVKDYKTQNGIIHHRITPLWPQANGLVERFNRPLMKAIRAAHIQGKDIELET